jgi:hypothetical protein
MSQEEEDQLVGRAIREKAQTEKRLAIIGHELERLSKGLTALQNELTPRTFHGAPPSPLSIPPEVSQYLDCTKLLALIESQNQLLEERASLVRAISGTGPS